MQSRGRVRWSINSEFKICTYINWFPPFPYIGGTEIDAYRLSRTMVFRGVKLFVLTRKLKGMSRYELIDGIPVHRVYAPERGRFSSFIFMITSSLYLIRHRKEYSIIHAHLISSHLITAILLGKLLKKKVVLTVGGSGIIGDVQASRKNLLGRIKLSIIKKIDGASCLSEDIKKELAECGIPENKMRKIGLGLDTSVFRPVTANEKSEIRKELGLPEKTIVLYVGRHEPNKGLELLVRAWNSIVKKYGGNVLLVMVGDGAIKTELEKMAEKSGIGSHVVFTGVKRDTLKFYQAGDIYVLPSLSEGLSTALVEAMSCGLAVITTCLSGNKEIIRDNVNGVLINPDSEKELENSIKALLDSAEKRAVLGNNARKTIEDNYSNDRIAELHLELYRGLFQ